MPIRNPVMHDVYAIREQHDGDSPKLPHMFAPVPHLHARARTIREAFRLMFSPYDNPPARYLYINIRGSKRYTNLRQWWQKHEPDYFL